MLYQWLIYFGDEKKGLRNDWQLMLPLKNVTNCNRRIDQLLVMYGIMIPHQLSGITISLLMQFYCNLIDSRREH